MTAIFKKRYYYLLPTIIVSVIIIITDLIIPLGVAIGTLYVSVILIFNNTYRSNAKQMLYLASILSILVLAGYFLSPDGGEIWKVIMNRFISIIIVWVITILLVRINRQAKNKFNIEQEAALEKAILLKEIHHRVKNNLQVITSLLSLQSSFVDDEKVKELFKYTQYRINSMALVHEMLYNTNDIKEINYHDYLSQLMSSLLNSMKGKNSIELKVNTSDIYLNIDTSIPLGLLINEIVTNALKYGLKDNPKGKLHAKLTKAQYPYFVLEIGDNGKGFDDDINLKTIKSLGLKLIQKLTQQLKGRIIKDKSKEGTNYILTFQQIKQTS